MWYRLVSFPMNLSDSNPGLRRLSQKMVHFRDIVTIGRWREAIGRLSNGTNFYDLGWPLTWISGSQYFLEINYVKNGASKSHSYYWILIGSHIRCEYEVIYDLTNGDREWPLTWVTRSRHFSKSIISRRCIVYCLTAVTSFTELSV